MPHKMVGKVALNGCSCFLVLFLETRLNIALYDVYSWFMKPLKSIASCRVAVNQSEAFTASANQTQTTVV